MKDLRNAMAKARDKFFASLDEHFLRGNPSGIYLKNRIDHAFCKGYAAGESTPPSSQDSDRRDAERLSFMITHEFLVRRMVDSGLFMLLDNSTYPVSGDEFETAIEAIDAAMRKEGK